MTDGRSEETGALRRKRGRTSLRVNVVRTRLTAEEMAAVRAEARARYMTIGSFLRRRLLGRRLPRAIPEINRETWLRLGPLASDLNQYVRAIDKGQADASPLPLLEALRLELKALRRSLIDVSADR
jgi:hypothetical protein